MSDGKNFHLIAQGMRTQPLLEKLDSHPWLWAKGPRETFPGSPHAQAQSVLIRWVDLPAHLAAMSTSTYDQNAVLNEADSVDQPAAAVLMPEVGELVMDVLERLGAIGSLGHVMLTRLRPGQEITEHTDEGIYAELHDRFHLCLQGSGDTFACGGELFYPEPGDMFWFNHKRPHHVRAGFHERIHLIVDVMAPHFTRLRGTYYQQEMGANLWDEIEPLLARHWEEIAHWKDIQLAPDQEAYARLEAEGQLRCYTARRAGELIGYAVFFVRQNHHYKGSKQAWQDVLFVAPEHRAGLVGIRLIRHAEQRLRAEGVQVVYHHAKLTNRVGELLQRLGYEEIDRILGKRLDREEGKGS